MKRILPLLLGLLLGLLLCGCAPENSQPKPVPPPPPKPTIKVEQSETNNDSSVMIVYENHHQDHLGGNSYGKPYAQLKNLEDLKAYKTEVEFLLKLLDEAEKKMQIHEDGQNGQEKTSP